jgi:predicted acetyltransferase
MLIFDRFAGSWEVLEYERNRGSVAFWRRVLSVYTGGKFVERAQDGQVRQRFSSRSQPK